MTKTVSRRDVLGGVSALAVLGFSSGARAWVGGSGGGPLSKVPALDGQLLTDPSSLAAVSVDAGYSQTVTPLAVLRPGSVADIQKMIRFCRRHGILVAARGQGHTTFGQALVQGGLVIEMGSLATVHSIGSDHAIVDAGLKWSDLLQQTLAHGLTPPALTGYLGLSIGGTLSVGGISSSPRAGAQVDNVREIEFVDGKGDLIVASKRKNPVLFAGVLAGLGQLGIITRATVELVPAPTLVRVYTLDYANAATFFTDMRTVLERGEFDDCYNFGIPNGTGGWNYQLTMGIGFEPTSPPDTEHLLRGLSAPPASAAYQDMPFSIFALRVDMAVEFFRSIGLWEGVQHPWFDVFLPDRTVEPYVTRVTASLTFEDVGPTGFLLLFPQKRRGLLDAPLLQSPDCDRWFYLFDILTAAPAPGFDADFDARMRARNRRLYDEAKAVGGARYPIGTLDFDEKDWRKHFGLAFPGLKVLKALSDPGGILTPGPGIFG
ncbi:MAG TPA: FAD-binding protein [Polyangiaceae bacterium]|nr:FAD-binding protein [Polyangiaceae bacterium]